MKVAAKLREQFTTRQRLFFHARVMRYGLPVLALFQYHPAMFRLLPLFVFALLCTVHGQTPAAPTPGSTASARPIFRAELPAGTYQVATQSMISVSSHEYVIDGAARVSEVNIDTAGALVVRFYFIEPNLPTPPAGSAVTDVEKAQQLLQQGTDKTGVDLWKRVVKNYPTTTHARTVEYRLVTKDDLGKIFNAADEAFRLQQTKRVKIE